MAIELAGYRPWQGQLRPTWFAAWPIVRTGVWLVLRRKLFWPLFALGLFNFLLAFTFIYIKAQFFAEAPAARAFLGGPPAAGASGSNRAASKPPGPFGDFMEKLQVSGTGQAYRDFMFGQGLITMLLLAFTGAVLIGTDHQQAGLTFYLARRLGKSHYIAGKVLAATLLVLLIVTVPTLVLYAAYGMFSSSFDYFLDNPRILLAIIGYGLFQAVVLSLLLAALAFWLSHTVPLVMTWTGIFLLLPALGESLRFLRDNDWWRLLNLRADIDILGSRFFGCPPLNGGDSDLTVPAACVVATVCGLCLFAMLRRVRAVEIVK